MEILRNRKHPRNKPLELTILHYIGAALIFLFIPIASLPLSRRLVLYLSIFCLLAVGTLFEARLVSAQLQDRSEKDTPGGGLNASTLLFFAIPIMFVADITCIAILFKFWYDCGQVINNSISARLQIAGTAAGIGIYIIGRIFPKLPYRSHWGICTQKTLKNESSWKTFHKSLAKCLLITGTGCTILNIFLSGKYSLLTIAVSFAAILVYGCFFIPSSQL